jgi:hypothetical protein
VRDGVILDWDETHPVLRHVALDAVDVFMWLDLRVDHSATKLIEANNGPVLALLDRPRRQYLICAFGFFGEARETLNTDWVFDESLVIFMHNSLRYLSGTSEEEQHRSVEPGGRMTVPVSSGDGALSVRRPDGREGRVVVHEDGLASYHQTDRVGFYRFENGLVGHRVRCVNLLDARESFIAPRPDLRIAGGAVRTGKVADVQPRPLWPYLLMAMVGMLFVEWFVYCRHVRV